MFIVNDELLETLTCSKCKKYLSVKPIKCYPNMGIRCGRCATSSDAGAVSLFGVLAERALFRCVNRFEGCNQLLGYAEVEDHERICVGNNYDCPCCLEPFSGTAYDIYVHFKQQHKNLLLNNNPEFSIEIDNETSKTYLYRKNDLLFFIDARFTIGNEQIILNVTYLGTDRDASRITQMFELRSIDGKLQNKTKNKPCCSVSEGCLQYFKVKLSPEDYPKGLVVCKVDLMTNYVDSLVVLPEKYDESANKDMTDKEVNNNDESVTCVTGQDADENKENQNKNDAPTRSNQFSTASNLSPAVNHVNPVKKVLETQKEDIVVTHLAPSTSKSTQCQTDPFSTAPNLSPAVDQGNPVKKASEPKKIEPVLIDLKPPTSINEPKPSGSTVLNNIIDQSIPNQIGIPHRAVNQQPFVFCQNNSPVYVDRPSINISNKTVNQVNNNIFIHQTQQKEIQKPTYPCTVCGRVITSQIGLWSHMRTHRSKSPELPRVQHKPRVAAGRNQGGGRFSCPDCGRVISSQIGLWSHMRTHK